MKILKSGNSYFINCAVTLPWHYTLNKSREICKEIKKAVSEKLNGNIKLNIHTSPCNVQHCSFCALSACEERQNPFISLLPFSLESITSDKGYI